MSRGVLPLLLLGLTVGAFAADPIREFRLPDGRIRLWLHGAPTVTASNSAGWKIEPVGKEKDKTWLERLKKVEPGSSPWKNLLDAIANGETVTGVEAVTPSATLSIEPGSDGTLKLRVSDTQGKQATANLNYQPHMIGGDPSSVTSFIMHAFGITPAAMEAGLWRAMGMIDHGAPNVNGSTTMYLLTALDAGPKAAPILFDTATGPVVVAVHVAGPAATSPPTQPTTSPADQAPATKEAGAQSWLWVSLAALVGFAAGFAVRAAIRPRALVTLTETLAKRDEELARARADLGQTKAAAREFRDQNAAWTREREETLRALAEERAGHAAARKEADAAVAAQRQAVDDANRTKLELGKQVETLQRAGRKSQAEAETVSAKARIYSDLEQEVAEAFNYMQSEIGRPEISAAVGYLLSYSCAALLDAVAKPNPAFERAMLANVERIASQFPNAPHARKLVATVQRLSAPLGSGAIPDSQSPHAHARHFDEVLRFLRHQRGLELSPFYFAVDKVGAIHAVYV